MTEPRTATDLLAEVQRLGLVDRPKRLAAFEPAIGPADELAARLVVAGLLTPFQAEELVAGNGARLVLKQYILLDRIGSGGMGQVFKARHRTLGRIDALKLIRAGGLAAPEALRRFRQEARLAARCSHTNLVAVFDADEVDGVPFLAMEFVPGTDLHRLVRDVGPLEPGRACDYVRQAALGLHHAHEQGFIHRDVKPANLLVAGGRVRVTDLGLARAVEPEPDDGPATESGAVLGTPDFLAPEQCSSGRTVDRRLDIYSLGCTLYFLLTGRPPFPGGTAAEKLLRHLTDRPTPIAELCRAIPPPVAELLNSMLARDPAERPPTAEAVAERLAPFSVASLDPVAPGGTGTDELTHAGPETAGNTDTGWIPSVAPPLPAANAPVMSPARWRRSRAAVTIVALVALAGVVMALTGWPFERKPTAELPPTPPGANPEAKLPDPPDPSQWQRVYLHQFPLGVDDGYGVYAGNFSGDGRRLVVGVGSYSRPDRKGAVHLFEFEPGGTVHATLLGEIAATAGCVALTPDGQTAAVGCGAWGKDAPGEVSLWDLGNKSRLAAFTAHATGVHGVAFDATGQFLVTAGHDGAVRVWRLPIGTTPTPIELVPPGRSPQTAVAVSPDRSRLAVGNENGAILTWDMTNWTVAVPAFTPAGRGLRSLAFGPGGRQLAAAFDDPESQQSAVVWNAQSGAVLRKITPDDRAAGLAFVSVGFHPDGRTLIVMRRTNDLKGEVEFWDIPTGWRDGSLRERTDPREVDAGLAAVGSAAAAWLLRPAVLVDYSTHWATGNFVAVDPSSGRVASGGDDINLFIWGPPKK